MITREEALRLQQNTVAREVMDLRIYVIGGGFQYEKMFFDAGFKGARTVDDADIVCFTGGEDVDPALYNEKPLPRTGYNSARDEREGLLFAEAVLSKKPMVGICRGAQFLNVMNKGRLWQDINNHAIGGTHSIIDMRTGQEIDGMTSTHHQQMIPALNGVEVIALAALSTFKQCEKEEIRREEPEMDDYEVLWYPDTLSLCFQPHPEHREGGCRNFFLDLLDNYIIPAT